MVTNCTDEDFVSIGILVSTKRNKWNKKVSVVDPIVNEVDTVVEADMAVADMEEVMHPILLVVEATVADMAVADMVEATVVEAMEVPEIATVVDTEADMEVHVDTEADMVVLTAVGTVADLKVLQVDTVEGAPDLPEEDRIVALLPLAESKDPQEDPSLALALHVEAHVSDHNFVNSKFY
jgi:hypothetical protein